MAKRDPTDGNFEADEEKLEGGNENCWLIYRPVRSDSDWNYLNFLPNFPPFSRHEIDFKAVLRGLNLRPRPLRRHMRACCHFPIGPNEIWINKAIIWSPFQYSHPWTTEKKIPPLEHNRV